MGKWFDIEEKEFDDLPDPLKNALKTASAESETNKGLAAKIAELETKLAAAPEKKVEPVVANPENPFNVPPADKMLYDNRRDIILMTIQSGQDKKRAVCATKFRDEITKTLASSHPSLSAQEGFVYNVIDMIVGRHLTEILTAVKAGDNSYDFFTESGGGGNNGNSPVVKTADQTLSDEQKRVAKSCGITNEAYLESLKAIGVIN